MAPHDVHTEASTLLRAPHSGHRPGGRNGLWATRNFILRDAYDRSNSTIVTRRPTKPMPVALEKSTPEKRARTVLMRPPPNPTRIKVTSGSLSILSFFNEMNPERAGQKEGQGSQENIHFSGVSRKGGIVKLPAHAGGASRIGIKRHLLRSLT